MPALVFCNRRWRIGSDDFPLPGIVEILIRVAWLLLVALLFIQHEQVSCSSGSTELRIYLIGVVIVLAAVICVTIALVVTSAKGGVMDVEARRRVPTILSIRIAMAFPEVAWQLMGSIWIFTGRVSCNDHAPLWVLLKALLVVTWCALFFVLFLIVLLFEPMLRPDYNAAAVDASARSNTLPSTGSTYALHASMGSHYIQLWERRCRILCCASSKDETSLEALRNVADILASIFEDNELVASDIAAALVLLRMQQKYKEKREKREMSRRRNRRQQERQEDLKRRESEFGVQNLQPGASASKLEATYDGVQSLKPEENAPEVQHLQPRSNAMGQNSKPVTDAVVEPIIGSIDIENPPPLEMNVDVNATENAVERESLDPNESPRIKLELGTPSPTASVSEPEPTPGSQNILGGSEMLSPVQDTPEFYVAPPNSCVASPPHPWMTVANAQHYMKFALASYGWPWYMYGRCFTTFGSMWPFLKFGANCCTRSAPESVYGDNCCLCHTAAMKAITGLDDEDFCLVYHLNNIYEVPFFVAVDHDTSSVIVAIRGTMSLKDTITDMTAQTAPVYGAHCSAPHCLAHKGMVHAADFVYDKLKETQVLHRLLSKFPQYRLVVTGHSLGAGAAVVLTARLRQDCEKLRSAAAPDCNNLTDRVEHAANFVTAPTTARAEVSQTTNVETLNPGLALHSRPQEGLREPCTSDQVIMEQVTVISAVPAASMSASMCTNNVFSTALSRQVDILCFAYSPPGGLCSEEFAQHTLEYVMSVVIGDDLVPRLSMHSLHDLRAQIVTVLEECHQPKFRLLAQGCWFMLFGISEATLRRRFTDSSLYNGGNNVRRRKRRNRHRVDVEEEEENVEGRVQVSHANDGNETAVNSRPENVRTLSGQKNSPTFGPKTNRASRGCDASEPYETDGAVTGDEENFVSDSEIPPIGGSAESSRARATESFVARNNRSQSVTPTSSSSSQPLLTASTGRLRNYESLENVRSPPAATGGAPQRTHSFAHSPRHTETTLCLPGHVLHVRPSNVNTPGRWKVQWAPPCQFTTLVISPHMMRHHLPQEVMKAMDFVLEHNMVPERS